MRATRGTTPTPSSARSSTLLGARLGGRCRVLVDANQHVDREAAARSGVGFYGKNTMLITQRHGSWVVLGTLVTDVELEPTPPLDTDCGDCRICIDACPTGALDEPGVLDSTRCLSYWTQAPAAIPEPYRAALGAQVYGCDICQDVCPWNRGVAKRRDADRRAIRRVTSTSSRWLEQDGRAVVDEYDRLYVPRNEPRWLRGTRSSRSATRAARAAPGRARAVCGRRRRAARRARAPGRSSAVALGLGARDGRSSAASSRARCATRARSSCGSSTIASPR